MDYVRHQSLLPANQNRPVEAALHSTVVRDAEPSSGDSLAASATLVTTPCGAPIRTIVTGRRVITTGVYASRKAGRPQPYESMNERAFFMHCEVDTDVIDYRAQPFRLEFVLDGRKRTYIADCVRVLASGDIELVEIKSDPSSVRDPDYRQKLEAVRAICAQVGWRFRLIFEKSLTEPAVFHRNIIDVQFRRMTKYSDTDVFRVVEALGRQSGATLGDVIQNIGSCAEGLAKLKAMMVGRIVRLDLTEQIGDATPVGLVSGEES